MQSVSTGNAHVARDEVYSCRIKGILLGLATSLLLRRAVCEKELCKQIFETHQKTIELSANPPKVNPKPAFKKLQSKIKQKLTHTQTHAHTHTQTNTNMCASAIARAQEPGADSV